MSAFLSGFADLLRGKKNVTPDYTAQSLFTVRNAKQLLVEHERTGYLKKINDLVKMPAEHFDPLYGKLVDNFIEFVQILPVRYREHLTGILQDSLRHGLMALQLLSETASNKPQPIYQYAVFSMALLADTVKVIATQKVMISDADGIYIDEWCPFAGSLVEQGAEFYKIREYGGYRQAFLNSANPLLAQKVMPELGMRWIGSNPRIFDMWLAVLTGHEDWAGELGFLLKLLKKQLDEHDKKLGLWLDNIPIDSQEPQTVADGEKFLEWLKDALENKKISVNEADSFVHILEDGVFIQTPEVYDAFNHTYSSYRDFIVLQKQFNYLGVTKLSGYDFRFEQYFAQRGDTASRLGFLNKQQQDSSAAKLQAGNLAKQNATVLDNQQAAIKHSTTNVHQKIDLTKQVHTGLIITDPAILYSSLQAVPPVSSQMKDIAVNWSHANALPKLRVAHPVAVTHTATMSSNAAKNR